MSVNKYGSGCSGFIRASIGKERMAHVSLISIYSSLTFPYTRAPGASERANSALASEAELSTMMQLRRRGIHPECHSTFHRENNNKARIDLDGLHDGQCLNCKLFWSAGTWCILHVSYYNCRTRIGIISSLSCSLLNPANRKLV